MRKSVVVLVLSAATALLPGETPPRKCLHKLATMPDYYQADRAYGELPNRGRAYCGPTAAANALVWLDANGFDRLLPAARPGPKEQFALIRTLGTPDYTRTDPVKGVGPARLMSGVAKYCLARGYRAHLAYMGWRTSRNRLGRKPSVAWLTRQIEGTSCLLVNIGWYKLEGDGRAYVRTGGHYLTAVGYELTDAGAVLHVHDPAKRNNPRQRNSTSRCPVACRLKPLPADATMQKQDGKPFPAAGYFALDGIRVKKGNDAAIVDGAISFTLASE